MYSHRQIWRVAYPIMLGLLAQNVINITDTAFLGHVGEIELGGSALGGLWYLAIYMLGFGFCMGAQILIGRRNGEGRQRDIAPYLTQGILFLLALATLIVVLTEAFAAPLLHAIIRSKRVYEATVTFIDWRIYGLLFAFPTVMFRSFFVGITQTRTLTVSALVMAIVNIGLDYLLIFGHLGFPALGLKGAAIASVIAEAAALLYFVVYLLRRVDLETYGFRGRTDLWTLSHLPHLLGVSVWTMIQYFIALATWFVFFLATEHLGERSLAVSNIVRSIGSILFMPVSAYGTTAGTLVSNLMGEGRIDSVPRQTWRVALQCALVVAPLMLLIFLLPKLWLSVYTDDASLIQASVGSLVVLACSYFLAVPGSVLHHFVSGTGNTRSALAIEASTLVAYVAFIVVVAFWMAAPVALCWLAESVYWGFLVVACYLYMKRADWQSKKI